MGALARWFWWLPFGSVPEISAAELARRLDEDPPPLLLDVRTEREFREGHLRGARHLPVGGLKRALEAGELAADREAGRAVVAICLSAHRSIPAVRLLAMHGFPQAVQLEGGMRVWAGERIAGP